MKYQYLILTKFMEKVAVVTGSSSGIGFETALALARDGFYTYATMRNISKAGSILDISETIFEMADFMES